MRYFLSKSLTVRRLHKVNATRSAASATGTAYDCSLQDPTPDRVQLYNGQIGKVFDLFVPDSNSNIKAGDEVVIGSSRYSVRAKETVDFGGMPHLAFVVVLED